MTDYAATVFGRATLVAAASQRFAVNSGDDTELRQRERNLEDALDGGKIEVETEIKRTSELIGQVATLEGKIRNLEDELRVVLMEKGEQTKLIEELDEKRIAYSGELFKKTVDMSRLQAEIRCLKAQIPKADK